MLRKGETVEKIIKALLISIFSAAILLLDAQFVIWGLAMYHVSSGIWPAWLISSGVTGVLTVGVASGIRAVRDEQ
jgi:hypothetical protein